MLKVLYSRAYNEPLRRQLLQERLCLLQIACVKLLREPAVNRSKQFARFLRLALITRRVHVEFINKFLEIY
jgi:hypothetical protein